MEEKLGIDLRYPFNEGDLSKAIDANTGQITLSMAELPNTGEGTVLHKIRRDRKGRLAASQAANTDDLPEGQQRYFTANRAITAMGSALEPGGGVGLLYDTATGKLRAELSRAIQAQ